MPRLRAKNLKRYHHALHELALELLNRGFDIKTTNYSSYLMSYGISHALFCRRTKEYLSHITDLKYHLIRREIEGNTKFEQWLKDVQVMFFLYPHPDATHWSKFVDLVLIYLKNIYQFYEWSSYPILLQIAAESFECPALQKQAHAISKSEIKIPWCSTTSRMSKTSLGQIIASHVNYADISKDCIWYSRDEQLFVEFRDIKSVYAFEHKIFFVSASTKSKSAFIGTANEDYYVVTLDVKTIVLRSKVVTSGPIDQVVYVHNYWAWTYRGVLVGGVDILNEQTLVQSKIEHPWIGAPEKVRIEPNQSLIEYQSSETGNVIWDAHNLKPLLEMPSLAVSWFSATLTEGIWIHSADKFNPTTLISNMGINVSDVKHIVNHNNEAVVIGFADGTWSLNPSNERKIRFQSSVHNVHCAAIDDTLNQLHLWGDSTSVRTRTRYRSINGRLKLIRTAEQKKQFRWAIYDLKTGKRLFLRSSKQRPKEKTYELRVHEEQLIRISWDASMHNPSRIGSIIGWTLQPEIMRHTYSFRMTPYSDLDTVFSAHQFKFYEGFSPYDHPRSKRDTALAPENGFVRFVNDRLVAGTAPHMSTLLAKGTRWRGLGASIVVESRKVSARPGYRSWQQHMRWEIDAEIADILVFESNLIVTTWSGDIYSLDSNGSVRRIHTFSYDLVFPPNILSRTIDGIHLLQYPNGIPSHLLELKVDMPGEISRVKAVTNLVYLPKMEILVSVDFNGTVYVWDVLTRTVKFVLNDGRSQLGKLVLDTTERILATGCTGWCGHNPCGGCDHHGWLLWDLSTGTKLDPHGRIFEMTSVKYLPKIDDWMHEYGFLCSHESIPVQSTHSNFHQFQDVIWSSSSSISVVCEISNSLYAIGDNVGNVYFVDVH